MAAQQYEDYWPITLAHTDILDEKFNGWLQLIIDYIDTNATKIAQNKHEAYEELQSIARDKFEIGDASVRKALNQFAKLGFIYSGLSGYHVDTKQFLSEQNETVKLTIFSKIVYENAAFKRSFDTVDSTNQLNFLIRTLENVGKLSKDDIVGLMTVDVSTAPEFYNRDEVTRASEFAKSIDFAARKYNQIGYLWGILKRLGSVKVVSNWVYMADDPTVQDDVLPKAARGRDSYLQRLYKDQLIAESRALYGATVCMVEKLDYPSLIASHIKPYAHSNPEEEFDGNNGLLLCRSIDQLFDGGYISFADDGTMLVSKSRNLSTELTEHLSQYSLDQALLNPARKAYLQYHRDTMFTA